MYPRSNCMPSTTSSSVSSDFASSTVITPSLPTFFIASARNCPISASPLAEIVPTWAISSFEVTFLEFFCRSATMASTAKLTPRLRSIGFMPAATALAPSLTIAWASTVAVVVPSPAMSDVLLATSRTIWAPMFSNLSESSISLATVTPSLVMRGAPKDLSRTTLRPLGPSVTRTAFARMSTPRSIFSRASTENLTSFAAISLAPVHFGQQGQKPLIPRRKRKRQTSVDRGHLLLGRSVDAGGGTASPAYRFQGSSGCLASGLSVDQNPHNVAFLHDQIFDAIDLDLGAGPFAEQDPVSDLDIDRNELAGFVAATRAHADHLTLLRRLLGRVGNDDSTGGLLLSVDALDDDTVVKRTKFHWYPPKLLIRIGLFDCGRARRGVPTPSQRPHKRLRERVQEAGTNFLALDRVECQNGPYALAPWLLASAGDCC